MSFIIGQKVVCIDDSENPHVPKSGLKKGDIYTIKGFVYSGVGVLIQEIVSNSVSGGFYSSRFRPLDETFADELEARLKEEMLVTEFINRVNYPELYES